MKIKNWLIILTFIGISSLIVYPFIKNKFFPDNVIKIGVCCGEPPYEYLDKSGNPQGYLVDLIKKVFKNYNTPVQIEVIPFNLSFLYLNKGKISLLCTNLSITPQREKMYDFAVLFKNQIVFVYRTNNMVKDINYGVQHESNFEQIAQEKKVFYTGYKNFQGVILHFGLKKINGFVCDLNTLKQLLEKNYEEINTLHPLKIQWNDSILYLNHGNNKKIYGILSHDNLKYCGKNPVRLYYHLKDLLLAFRCGEINHIILKKHEINHDFNKFNGIQIKYNSNKIKVPHLSLKFMDNYWVIEKNNNKKNEIIGTLKNYNIPGYNEKVYDNWEILFNDLMEDKIDSIFLGDISDEKLQTYIGLANINYDIGITDNYNGIAFRKGETTSFDKDYKTQIKSIIETEASQDKNFNSYQELNYEEKN